MAVCTTAMARATIGGPGRPVRTATITASLQRSTALSVAVGMYPLWSLANMIAAIDNCRTFDWHCTVCAA